MDENELIPEMKIAGLTFQQWSKFDIDGLGIDSSDLYHDPKYRFIIYSNSSCKITIATDDMGTQICYNGCFFGPFSFKNIEEAVEFLKENKEKAVEFFSKVYTEHNKKKDK